MLDQDWHRVCRVSELDDEEVMQFWIDDLPIAVYCLQGEYYATSDTCSHQGGSLSEGYVSGEMVECPLHQGRYHIPSGAPHSGPACGDLATYPAVAHDDGWVYVQYAEDFE